MNHSSRRTSILPAFSRGPTRRTDATDRRDPTRRHPLPVSLVVVVARGRVGSGCRVRSTARYVREYVLQTLGSYSHVHVSIYHQRRSTMHADDARSIDTRHTTTDDRAIDRAIDRANERDGTVDDERARRRVVVVVAAVLGNDDDRGREDDDDDDAGEEERWMVVARVRQGDGTREREGGEGQPLGSELTPPSSRGGAASWAPTARYLEPDGGQSTAR